ncbi:hypothetical protein MHBO_004115 [Bonamia ostreae]|uniref:Uncharacterized protein n=1 Tax=Bonamia ostreae TaxID=126728 RepID=A0ABV2ASQ4_9EUKA
MINYWLNTSYDIRIPNEEKIDISDLISKLPDGDMELANNHAVDLWIILYKRYSKYVNPQ